MSDMIRCVSTTSPPPAPHPDLATVLRALAARSGAPALTWYDDDLSGRVELSARTVLNWTYKCAGLVREELDADTVRLRLPAAHWRTAYWALGTWLAGARLELGDPPADVDVVTSDSLLAEARSPVVVVVDLAMLPTPLRLPEEVSARLAADRVTLVDEGIELRSQPDQYGGPVGRIDVCRDGAPHRLPVEEARESGERVRLDSSEPIDLVLARLIQAWSSSKAVVILPAEHPRLSAVRDAEGV